MKIQLKTLLMVAVGILQATTLVSTNYFVALSGNNANNGLTISTAWRNINYALGKGNTAGDSIFIGDGIFEETSQLSVLKGVNLIGRGKDKTTILVNIFYDMLKNPQSNTCSSLTNPDKYSYHHRSDMFVMQVPKGDHQVIKGFTLNGQGKKCHGGIFSDSSKYVVYDDIRIEDFRFSGIWLAKSYKSDIQNSIVRNNTYGNSAQCTGNVMFYNANELNIHDNLIEETYSGSYGIKSYGKHWTTYCYWTSWNENILAVTRKLRIYNNTIKVKAVGDWAGGMAPSIAIEFQATSVDSCEIFNNTINNTVSLVGNFKTGTFAITTASVHIYNNFFDLGGEYRYAVEANTPNIEFDHNYVNGGYYPIAQWDEGRTDLVNQNYHHNVFYAPKGGQPLFSFYKDPGIKFDNNTVIDVNGITTLFRGKSTFKFKNTSFKNNIFMSTSTTAKAFYDPNAFESIDASNNLFFNVVPFGNNYLQTNPLLHLLGNKPLPFFAPKFGSPVIPTSIGAYLYDSKYDNTAIKKIEVNSSLKINVSNSKLSIISTINQIVNIYNLSGMLVFSEQIIAGVKTLTLKQGMYILVSNNDRIKFAI